MPKRKLYCYVVMVNGGKYRAGGRIHTVHAASANHAMSLLKKSGLRVWRTMYMQQNTRCTPETGIPCPYKLVAKPDYDQTPDREVLPNSPEWHKLYGEKPTGISESRNKAIENMRRRKDIGDADT